MKSDESNLQPYDADELNALCAGHCDGRLSEEEFARLEALLAESPEARAQFLRYMNLESALHEYGEPAGLAWGESAHPLLGNAPAQSPTARWMPWALAASLVALLTLGVWKWNQPEPKSSNPITKTAAAIPVVVPGVAVLAKAVGVEWESPALPVGTAVPAGRLLFSAGLVRLEFYSGAAVILEGPADFELLGIDLAKCHRGKLRAIVPEPAAGFTVLTPQARLVDLGTEFGIDVAENGPAEVHVFDGRVEVYPPDGQTVTADLTAGKAARINAAGQLKNIPADPTRFISAPEIAAQADARVAEQFARWREASVRWKTDPRLLAYYDFQRNDKPRRLHSQWTERPWLNGAIIGCRWAEGRWPGKGALEFKNPGDRVRLPLRRRENENRPDPDNRKDLDLPALTFATWVRIDALDQSYHSLLTADGKRRYAPAWQITGDGRLQFILQRQSKLSPWISATKPVFKSRRLGQWIHLALSIDTLSGRVIHYVNGQRVASASMPRPKPLRGGSVELGNWGRPPKDEPKSQRRFNGRMDEFMIFGEALDDKTILEIYQAGQPGV
ncbi:MAG: FecR domain-containing protein [Verrucomicrobia subdivision 3 bacterium]|nr:FecR domain-containing protein [Limisphaerales bacterium]